MFVCIYNKCNWCNKRRTDVVKIKMNCKWYNFNICSNCYTNKILYQNNKKPISKPDLINLNFLN